MVRALALQARGHWFKSSSLHQKISVSHTEIFYFLPIPYYFFPLPSNDYRTSRATHADFVVNQ